MLLNIQTIYQAMQYAFAGKFCSFLWRKVTQSDRKESKIQKFSKERILWEIS